jgi:hypothetical protein
MKIKSRFLASSVSSKEVADKLTAFLDKKGVDLAPKEFDETVEYIRSLFDDEWAALTAKSGIRNLDEAIRAWYNDTKLNYPESFIKQSAGRPKRVFLKNSRENSAVKIQQSDLDEAYDAVADDEREAWFKKLFSFGDGTSLYLCAGWRSDPDADTPYCKIAGMPDNSGLTEYDYDFVMPYDPETGDVFDTEIALPAGEKDADWLNEQVAEMLPKIQKGEYLVTSARNPLKSSRKAIKKVVKSSKYSNFPYSEKIEALRDEVRGDIDRLIYKYQEKLGIKTGDTFLTSDDALENILAILDDQYNLR